jgi:ferredoxin/flavodoxin
LSRIEQNIFNTNTECLNELKKGKTLKKLGIYYFSGTGNTKITANLVKQSFITLGWNVDLVRIEDVNKGITKLNIEQYDLIGIGSQVIGYGIPGVVRIFAKGLPAVLDRKKVFIFRTAGGVAPMNYNASKGLIRILRRKHYDVCYEQLFSIGSNWIIKFDDVIMKQLYQATKQKITLMCEAINHRERHFYRTGIVLRIKMDIIAALSARIFPFLGKDAIIDNSCRQCGLCTTSCPADNITITKGKIKFRNSCSACLRCVYSCPEQAIHFRLLHFVTIPDGYNVTRSLSEEGNPSETPNGKIPPFFNSYVENHSQ